MRVTPPRIRQSRANNSGERQPPFVRLNFSMGLTTAPLGGVLFLLVTTATGRREIKDGTIGANNIVPLDIVAFALTIGYIINSIDVLGPERRQIPYSFTVV